MTRGRIDEHFDLCIFDSAGKRVTEADEEYEQPLKVINDYLTQKLGENAAQLAQYEIADESGIFTESAEEAEKFLLTLGLRSNASFHSISREGREALEVEWQASYCEVNNQIDLYADKLIETRRNFGSTALRAIFVHECIHATKPRGSFGLSNFPKGSTRWIQRGGFQVLNTSGDVYGGFYEEGFAEYIAGLYTRRENDPTASMISVPTDELPPIELPSHYRSEAKVAGFDGYAIELLAYGLERKGIAGADTLINAFIASRHKETEASSLRTIARLIDQVKPGLYTELQKLKYGREEWQHGLSLVYEAVTA